MPTNFDKADTEALTQDEKLDLIYELLEELQQTVEDIRTRVFDLELTNTGYGIEG